VRRVAAEFLTPFRLARGFLEWDNEPRRRDDRHAYSLSTWERNRAVKTWFIVLACLVVIGCNSKPKTGIAHFVAFADRGAATNRDPWYADSDEPTPSDCEVPQPLVLPVPHSNTDSAVSMLKSASVVALNMQQAQTLLGVKELNPDSLLERAAKDADAQAEKREKESQIPFFAGDTAEKMKQWAREHRQTAAKTRSLKGKLKPYLVRGVYLNEGTGAFYVYFRDTTLWVAHCCLGKHAVPMKRRPLIVFLEHAPTKVYVSVGMAE